MVKKLVLADVETGELPPVVESHLNTAFVRFRDQNGNSLPPGSVTTIVINTVTGDVDDIIFEEA